MNSIGIEITKNEIKVGLVGNGDKPELLSVAFMPVLKTLSETLSGIADLAKELLEAASLSVDDISFAGVSIDAPVVGTVAYGSVFGDEADFSALKSFLPVKDVRVIKTQNALAIAEEVLTYGKGYSFAYITLDETIGFGLLIDGKPYTGANGLAADIAHTTVQRGGKKCTCGNNGCFEAYASLSAFESEPRDEYVSYLACGITNVMNLFQPNVIVVGGKVMEIGGDELLREFGETVHAEQYARNSVNKTLLALPSAGPNAAVIGAALYEN